MPFVIALLFCGVVPDYVCRRSTDWMELNHVVSAQQDNAGLWIGKVSLSQVIFWHLDKHGTPYVREWRLLSECSRPAYDHRTQLYRCSWLDRGGRLFEVTSGAYCETWSLTDPEVENRKLRKPAERRRF